MSAALDHLHQVIAEQKRRLVEDREAMQKYSSYLAAAISYMHGIGLTEKQSAAVLDMSPPTAMQLGEQHRVELLDAKLSRVSARLDAYLDEVARVNPDD